MNCAMHSVSYRASVMSVNKPIRFGGFMGVYVALWPSPSIFNINQASSEQSVETLIPPGRRERQSCRRQQQLLADIVHILQLSLDQSM